MSAPILFQNLNFQDFKAELESLERKKFSCMYVVLEILFYIKITLTYGNRKFLSR